MVCLQSLSLPTPRLPQGRGATWQQGLLHPASSLSFKARVHPWSRELSAPLCPTHAPHNMKIEVSSGFQWTGRRSLQGKKLKLQVITPIKVKGYMVQAWEETESETGVTENVLTERCCILHCQLQHLWNNLYTRSCATNQPSQCTETGSNNVISSQDNTEVSSEKNRTTRQNYSMVFERIQINKIKALTVIDLKPFLENGEIRT